MKFPFLKAQFSRLGKYISPKWVHYADGLLNYLAVGRWFHDAKLNVPVRFGDRPFLYDYVATFVQEPVTYLEFGVFKGATLRHWSNLLKHPVSVLHGFDSFEGLPETWSHFVDKETLNVGGQMPQFEDKRVKLYKGWFSNSLPPYLRESPPAGRLVVHLDADLYSSTIFVLEQLKPFLTPGTILVFDEFFDRDHELKAFTEFLQSFPMGIECLGATRALTQVAFRIKSVPVAKP